MMMKKQLNLAVFLLLITALGHAQPRLTQEIDEMVLPLIEQINRYEQVKTIGIADFTTTNHEEISLGQQLADEFATSFVLAEGKQFLVVSRERLKALMDEAKMQQTGVLAPGNIARLGQLKGVDLLIGGTLNVYSSYARVNVQGIHLESGAMMAVARGKVTLTAEQSRQLGQEGSTVPAPKQEEEHGNMPGTGSSGPAFTVENLVITSQGCISSSSGARCRFSLLSKGSDTHLSLYTPRSTAHHGKDTYPITWAEAGNASGDRKVSAMLYANKPVEMAIDISTPSKPNRLSLHLSFYSNRHGTIDGRFENIPVTH